MRRVAVLGGMRIPFCRSHTPYAELSNLDMLTAALGGLVDRFALHGVHIDEVVGGAVVTHSKDWNLAREAVIGSALAPTTPGITMMQACATSLQGALGLAAKIATGQIESGISLGSDTTSDAPVVFQRRFAQRLVKVSRARSLGQRAAAFKGFSPAELAPQPPRPPSRAPGSAWASIASSWPRNGASPARLKTYWPMKAIRRLPRPMTRALWMTS